MKNIIYTLALLVSFSSFGQDFIGKRVNFKDFKNSKNINLSISIPDGWNRNYVNTSNDNDNFVASFVNKTSTKIIGFELFITEVPFKNISNSEFKQLFTSKEYLNNLPYVVINQNSYYVKGNLFLEEIFIYNNQKIIAFKTLKGGKLINIVLSSTSINDWKNDVYLFRKIFDTIEIN